VNAAAGGNTRSTCDLARGVATVRGDSLAKARSVKSSA
jgi:hypothetical protein